MCGAKVGRRTYIYAISPVEKAERYERSDEGSIPSSRAIYFGVGSSVGRTLVCGTGGRGIITRPIPHTYAVLAHLVECDLAKVEVTGSSPVYCSNIRQVA